jgi:hypothetical protein
MQPSRRKEGAMRKAKKSKVKRKKATTKIDENGFGINALIEYLNNRAVSELRIVEVSASKYRLEALFTWKAWRSVLVSARGGPRTFRSVDTLIRFFKQIGVGETVIRMELKS